MTDRCVGIRTRLAQLFGVSYTEINIWIFCVIGPLFVIALSGLVLWQGRRIRRLKQALRPQPGGASRPAGDAAGAPARKPNGGWNNE